MTLTVYQPVSSSNHITSSSCRSFKPDADSAAYKAYQQALNISKFETQNLVVCHPCREPLDVKESRGRRIQQILPELTGSHPVGYASFVIQGPKKQEGQLGDHLIGIEVYAPTKDISKNKLLTPINPGQYTDPDVNLDLAYELTSEQKQTLRTNSFEDLSLIKQEMPIIIFSHGMGNSPSDYRILLEEIASHGYVVINLHHPSSSRHVPFGEKSLTGSVSSEEEVMQLAQSQAENIQFVTKMIRQGELGDLSQELGSTNSIIIAGHSLGGAASIIAARNRDDYAGCINIDGRIPGNDELKTSAIPTSFLLLCATYPEEEWAIKMEQEWRTLLGNTPNSRGMQMNGIDHVDFASFRFILPWLTGDEKNCCSEMSINSILKAHKFASKQIKDFVSSIS